MGDRDAAAAVVATEGDRPAEGHSCAPSDVRPESEISDCVSLADAISAIDIEALRTRWVSWAAQSPCGMADRSLCADTVADPCPRRNHYECPQRVAEEARRVAQEQAARERCRTESRLTALRLPRRYWGLCLGEQEVRPTNAIEELSGEVGIVVLAGDLGVGKTAAACLWAWRVGAQFWTAAELTAVSRFSPQWQAIVSRRALVVDDLGTEAGDRSGEWAARLNEIVNAYYADCRQLVVTTNGDGDEIRRRFGERLIDRISEVGYVAILRGSSLRRREVER